jgi:hypothetical protein
MLALAQRIHYTSLVFCSTQRVLLCLRSSTMNTLTPTMEPEPPSDADLLLAELKKLADEEMKGWLKEGGWVSQRQLNIKKQLVKDKFNSAWGFWQGRDHEGGARRIMANPDYPHCVYGRACYRCPYHFMTRRR